jgi:hypothetical protein
MDCSVRGLAGYPGRTKERRERLAGPHLAARGKSQTKARRVRSAGLKSLSLRTLEIKVTSRFERLLDRCECSALFRIDHGVMGPNETAANAFPVAEAVSLAIFSTGSLLCSSTLVSTLPVAGPRHS